MNKTASAFTGPLAIPTPEGEFAAWYSDRGLARLDFPPRRGSARVRQRAGGIRPPGLHQWHRLTTRAVQEVLAGRPPASLPPLDLRPGTPFQQSVWRELLEIRPGEMRSYGEVAGRLGRPRASRAVGAACGANPIPLLVPCHRVVAAGGRLGGFSGGLSRKIALLSREGVTVDGSRVQQSVPRGGWPR